MGAGDRHKRNLHGTNAAFRPHAQLPSAQFAELLAELENHHQESQAELIARILDGRKNRTPRARKRPRAGVVRGHGQHFVQQRFERDRFQRGGLRAVDLAQAVDRIELECVSKKERK